MSVQAPPLADPHAALLRDVWTTCFRDVLGLVAGFPVSAEPESAEEAAADAGAAGGEVWAVVAASKALQGEMAIVATAAGAVQLAQALMAEPPDPAGAFDEGRRQAFDELLRQVLGQAATSLKGPAGGDVELKLAGNQAPVWESAARLGIRITGEKFSPIHLALLVSAELSASFAPPQQKTPAPQPASAATGSSAAVAPSSADSPNLEMLLDVTLDATICFGQKQMLLRDILELHPGAAIVLDRHVEEPVDLLVGGRMIARGEVVIVDGNYGLRITEILSPQQRAGVLAK